MNAIPDYTSRIQTTAKVVGLALTEPQIQQLQNYIALLIKWNHTYNLTALRVPEQILIHHIFDSLALVPSVLKYFDTKTRAQGGTIVDVGSGGGLPGVVLAICLPQWQTYCVDAVEKKTAFIRQVSGALRLTNLHACHGRIEKTSSLDADLIVSRAFASLHDFIRLSENHLKPEGVFVAMKGQVPEEEMQAIKQHISLKVWHIENLTVPELQAQRCLVWIRA